MALIIYPGSDGPTDESFLHDRLWAHIEAKRCSFPRRLSLSSRLSNTWPSAFCTALGSDLAFKTVFSATDRMPFSHTGYVPTSSDNKFSLCSCEAGISLLVPRERSRQVRAQAAERGKAHFHRALEIVLRVAE